MDKLNSNKFYNVCNLAKNLLILSIFKIVKIILKKVKLLNLKCQTRHSGSK
jgi:hypothetical protein